MTSSSDGIEVVPAALVRHAASVEAVAATVALGQDAARQMRLGNEAYGKLCQALPAMLEPVHDLTDRLLSDVQDALTATTDSLRNAGHAYGDTDSSVVRRFGVSG
jgi:Excreted virulence factor EspC, type VII ESX diderm